MDRPDLPETPIPAKPPKLEASTKIISKETIPLQNDSTCRRMEDLDDDEYGYNIVGVKCSEEKERDTDFENKFIDAKEFGPYNEETHKPATSRVFYSPEGLYYKFQINVDVKSLNIIVLCISFDYLQATTKGYVLRIFAKK